MSTTLDLSPSLRTRIARSAAATLSDEDKKLGLLSAAEASVFRAIKVARSPLHTEAAVARAAGMPEAAARSVLRQLQHRGLVQRSADPFFGASTFVLPDRFADNPSRAPLPKIVDVIEPVASPMFAPTVPLPFTTQKSATPAAQASPALTTVQVASIVSTVEREVAASLKGVFGDALAQRAAAPAKVRKMSPAGAVLPIGRIKRVIPDAQASR